ncbi:hypothetical protein CMU38_12895 [Elizabethkingia anophelis]|nr:hypothetical protein [Elizabethkingia anophelis]
MSRRLNKPDTAADIALRECIKNRTSFVVVAGAGSGKTTSLIKALKYIDDNEGRSLRQQGKRVACITYTTTAEKEILDDVGHDSLYHVSTIHSFLWELIKPFQKNIKKWVINKIQFKINELITSREGFGSRVQQKTRDKNQTDIIKYQEMAGLITNITEFTYETGSNYIEGVLGHNDIIAMVPELINSSPLLQTVISEKYPYFFIDESQDTVPNFIFSMKTVDKNIKNFCLGFFGDPMQKIYMTGAGTIALGEGWTEISKPENFRCSTDVLNIVNKIRIGGDDLQQTGGRKQKINGVWKPVKGSCFLFVLEADDRREEKIQLVREYLATNNNDFLWTSAEKEADLKILVMEHRMAAKRLKFGELFATFNDESTESLSSGFKEGTLWAVQPFIKFIIPIVIAHNDNKNFDVIELLRKFCPLLQKGYLQTLKIKPNKLFTTLKKNISDLVELMSSDTTTVKEVLQYLLDNSLIELDERISKRLAGQEVETLAENEETIGITNAVIGRFFDVSAKQFFGYQIYINDESPYSTQHSIKGAEFERVLVILDDEESNSKSYSYEKLLGITPFSDKDKENITAGNDNTPNRTRRLFYVCCSRALKDLAVVLFVSSVDDAIMSIKELSIFDDSQIKTESNL